MTVSFKIFWIFFFASSLFGTELESIKGQVRDSSTGKPLSGVNIFIERDGVGTTTDENGLYSIVGLSSGEHTIEFSHIGYTPHYESTKIPINNSLNIQLFPTLIQMDATVVTGTKTERYLKDTPVTTQVIKGNKLTNSGAADLSQLIQESTGVNIAENQFGTGVELNGFDSDNILILIDGMKVVGRVNGQLDISQIPINQIDQIEIIKGATSALYGSEAMGGVINILTKNPDEPNKINLENTLGSFGRQDHNLSFSKIQGDWRWALIGGLRKYGGYDLDQTTVWEDGSQYVKRNVHLKVDRKIGKNINFRMDARFFDEHQSLISSYVFRDKIDNDRSSLRAQIQYKKNQWGLNSSIEQSNYSHLFDRVVLNSGNILKGSLTENVLTSSNLNLVRESQVHHLMGGIGFDKEGILSDRLQTGERESNLINIFLQDEIHISSKWILLGGIRVDQHSIYGQNMSPKISIMYKPEMISRIRLAYGQGFRAPSFKELFFDYSNISVGYHIIGNAELEPESSQNINLDIERWHTGKYHARVNLFWNEVSGLIDYQYLGIIDGQSTYQSINLSKVQTSGIELDFTYFIRNNLESWLGYSFLDSWDNQNQRVLPLKAKHKVQAGFSYTLVNGTKFNMRFQHISEKINWETDLIQNTTVKYLISPFTTINAHMSIPLPWGLSGFVGGRNLTNQVDKVWGPMPGREWYGGIRFELAK